MTPFLSSESRDRPTIRDSAYAGIGYYVLAAGTLRSVCGQGHAVSADAHWGGPYYLDNWRATRIRSVTGTPPHDGQVRFDTAGPTKVQKPRLASRVLEKSLHELTELIPVGIFRTDTSGHCVYVNERWSQLTGLSREEASGYGWIRALHADDRRSVLRGWREAAQQAKEFADEYRIRCRDGALRTVSTRALPLFDESGQPAGYIVAHADVTERQQTEAALRVLAQKLSERVKELDCLIGISRIVDHSGGSLDNILRETVKLLPPSWQYSDITCARIVIDDLEFKSDNYEATAWRQTAEISVHEKPVGLVEVGYLEERPERDDGPFLAEERRVIDAVAVFLGRIAERLQAERLVVEREQELRERLTHLTRVSVMGEMASSIAHEINQPLSAIATYSDACRRLLEADAEEIPEIQEVLGRINQEALRAGEIVHRLRDLVRRREGKRLDCKINQLIVAVERLASVDARLHDVRLRLDLAPSLPPLHADPIQIQQVVLNLIRNGIDAMTDTDQEHREVIVRTALQDEGDVEVSVTDSGCGIPEGSEQQLFEPFFTTKEDGLGMGLSVSRSIIAAHGGRMWFTRNLERGATFFFTLPPRPEYHGQE